MFIQALCFEKPFSVMIKPVGLKEKTSAIFRIDPLFAFSLSGLIMASSSGRDDGSACHNSWVGKETLGVASHFSVDGATMILDCAIGKREDWEILLPNVFDRVFSRFSANRIPMYEVVFREVGFRLPFSPFQVSVFEWLELCPSQLRLDSFAYLIAFELLCHFLGLPATKDLFFAFFSIQQGLDKVGGLNWVCFRQRKALFEVFSSEALKFEEKFFLVRP
ncbi:hypothetical protein MtrunA17_Chr4g0022721 [Medicago truncatula]|uniref:Transposase (putative) gypsy type domain-containing protein n=1 Tax=Medicago truncatula TaxID=3880 RepID=A0A396I3K3_MEDTR|nr:hypothetical protein MtrunA17_Chr4g0022721 [Medicago truncatula]